MTQQYQKFCYTELNGCGRKRVVWDWKKKWFECTSCGKVFVKDPNKLWRVL